jgi:hypothetical protein
MRCCRRIFDRNSDVELMRMLKRGGKGSFVGIDRELLNERQAG